MDKKNTMNHFQPITENFTAAQISETASGLKESLVKLLLFATNNKDSRFPNDDVYVCPESIENAMNVFTELEKSIKSYEASQN